MAGCGLYIKKKIMRNEVTVHGCQAFFFCLSSCFFFLVNSKRELNFVCLSSMIFQWLKINIPTVQSTGQLATWHMESGCITISYN